MIYGHFTVYNKTIVHDSAKVAIAQNVYCRAYLGGNGVRVWDPLDPTHVAAFTSGELICDMFVTSRLMRDSLDDNKRTWWRSLTGRMPSSMSVTRDVAQLVWYQGCEAFSQFWQLHTDAKDYFDDTYRCSATNEAGNPADRKANVICMQELQMKWSPADGKYSHIVQDKGHWGEKVYPGCGRVRAGDGSFEIPEYLALNTTSLH